MLGIFLSFKNYLLFPLTTESAQQSSSILRIIRDKIILRKKIQNIKKKITHDQQQKPAVQVREPSHSTSTSVPSGAPLSFLDGNANHHKVFRQRHFLEI